MPSPLTPNGSGPSREVTPSSSSAHSTGVDLATNSSESLEDAVQIQEKASSQEDVDRFLKRMTIEKTMHALQQRLEFASIKTSHGWADMSIGEIETRLPPSPLRKKKSHIQIVPPHSQPQPHASTSQLPYDPPSPSRPWQLVDVLWQPLPPPSHGRYPVSPGSPKKRSRDEYPDSLKSSGHRRASSSAMASVYPYMNPASPLGYIREGERKKRSQIHSTHRSRGGDTTTQDVDAAKALTSMLESGRDSPRGSPIQAPALSTLGSTSLPIPQLNQSLTQPLRRSSSDLLTPIKTPSRRVNGGLSLPPAFAEDGEGERGDEDKSAAELMMFLAHSPSPAKAARRSSPPRSPSRISGAARVLFADTPPPLPLLESGDEGSKVKAHSNLVMAPPITARREENVFGTLLEAGEV